MANPQRHRVPRTKPANAVKDSQKAVPRTMELLRKVGPRPNVLQIVPPRHVYRPVYLRAEERGNHELVTNPLASPTGPGGAGGFAIGPAARSRHRMS